MAYVGSANNPVTLGAADVLNAIKTSLITAGWNLLASGDGTTGYSSTSTPDRVPDATAWNVTGAWCRLREPGGAYNAITNPLSGREYVFMKGAANAVLIKYSRATGFGTGGTASTVPTTGVGGDGAVFYGSAGNVGFSSTGSGSNTLDLAATTTAYTRTMYTATMNYVTCVASNTPVNGVYAFYAIGVAAGTGALAVTIMTESAQTGTFPTADADPSYRLLGSIPWGTNQMVVPFAWQYWQAYGLYTSAGVKSPPEYYVNNGVTGLYCNLNAAVSAATRVTPRVLGYGAYGATVQTYPMMIGPGSSSFWCKGMTTGFGSINVSCNAMDGFALTSSEPRVAISELGFVLPWIPNIVPLY